MRPAAFGSKEALLDTLFHEEYELRLERTALVDPAASGLEPAMAQRLQLEQLDDEDPEFLESMFIGSFEAVRRQATVRPRIADWSERMAFSLAEPFRAGVTDGSVRPELDGDELAAEVLASAVGVADGWIVLPGGFDLMVELARIRDRVERRCAPVQPA